MQALCRPLLITKRQQEELRLGGAVGQPNLMTSQEFDSFCVNGVFFLGRGSPSHTLHHFYRSDVIQDNSLSSRCPPHHHPPSPFNTHFLFSFSPPCSADDDSDERVGRDLRLQHAPYGRRQRPAHNPDE